MPPPPAAAAAAACAPPLPAEAAAARQWRQIERESLRELCELLELHRRCGRRRCRRARDCRGEAAACLRAGLAHAPAALAEFVGQFRQARADGLGLEDAFEELADFHDVCFAWTAGLAAGSRRKSAPV
jgi:hypothetical protein